MRKLLPAFALLTMCGCQQKVAVPTAQELINDRPLLAAWQAKCNTGEFSHLAPADKGKLCSTTHDATISVAQLETGKKEADFFSANTRRK